METQTQTQTPPDDDSLREWTIGICVALLSLFASWIVFGDDLMHLLQPPPAIQSATQSSGPTGTTVTPPVTPAAKPGD